MNPSLRQLQLACAKRADSPAFPHGLRDWTLTQWTNALAGETGELCNFAKKVERDGVNYDVDMGKELADIVIYATIVAEYVNINLAQSCCGNFESFKPPTGLRSRRLTDWTNGIAAVTGELCSLSAHNSHDTEEIRCTLLQIVTECATVAEYISLDLGDEVRKKFNEVSEKRGVDIKL